MHNYASLWQNVAECCRIFRIMHNYAHSAKLATFNVWGNALKNYATLCILWLHFAQWYSLYFIQYLTEILKIKQIILR